MLAMRNVHTVGRILIHHVARQEIVKLLRLRRSARAFNYRINNVRHADAERLTPNAHRQTRVRTHAIELKFMERTHCTGACTDCVCFIRRTHAVRSPMWMREHRAMLNCACVLRRTKCSSRTTHIHTHTRAAKGMRTMRLFAG